MELKDLFLTPIYLGIFYAIAYSIRGKFTNALTRKYFIPALSVKFAGAIFLGLIYQFYYGGGDTFNYFGQSKVIYQAFLDSPSVGLRLLLHSDGQYDQDMAKYVGQINWYRASTEYFVVKVAGFFSLFCFSTYAVVGLMFAWISFSGIWAMYMTFLRIAPVAYKQLATAVFFIPSVFFWGSGLMKDSLCLGALGWVFYGFYHALITRRNVLQASVMGGIGIYILMAVKIYILLSFLPPALLWVFNEYNQRIQSSAVRNLLRPVFLAIGMAVGYLGATNLTAGDDKYDVDKIGERTKINQEYLYSLTKDQGSSYNIGSFDGSLGSMVRVAPQAIAVTLYRPFLWEARNPIMLLSALEALAFLWLTIKLLFGRGLLRGLAQIGSQPVLTFCFLFSIILAIGVGTNSGNFGTLVRYKIPLMPFYLSALFIMRQAQIKKKVVRPSAMLASQRNKRLAFN
jgi:hypothetical protein